MEPLVDLLDVWAAAPDDGLTLAVGGLLIATAAQLKQAPLEVLHIAIVSACHGRRLTVAQQQQLHALEEKARLHLPMITGP